MTALATIDLHELAESFRALLTDLPPSASYGRDDVVSVIADIERLIDGWRPSDEDIAGAAHIDEWSLRGEILFGWISRHPWEPHRKIRSNTSGVIVVDRDLRWGRSIGRFYQLGEAEAPEQAEALRGLRVV